MFFTPSEKLLVELNQYADLLHTRRERNASPSQQLRQVMDNYLMRKGRIGSFSKYHIVATISHDQKSADVFGSSLLLDTDYHLMPGPGIIVHGDEIVGKLSVFKSPHSTSVVDVSLCCDTRHIDALDEIISRLPQNDYVGKTEINRIFINSDGEIDRCVVDFNGEDGLKIDGTNYPYLSKSPEEFWEGFKTAHGNVSLFIGPPGTGKSTYACGIATRASADDYGVYLCEDLETMKSPQFSNWLKLNSHRKILLILEEADHYIGKRDDGNRHMSLLLSATSGILPTKMKVLIMTNLAGTGKVEPALIRSGRRYCTLTFELLTAEQAVAIRAANNLEPHEFSPAQQYSLSDVLFPPKEDEFVAPRRYGLLAG